jgi:hypothetical protein
MSVAYMSRVHVKQAPSRTRTERPSLSVADRGTLLHFSLQLVCHARLYLVRRPYFHYARSPTQLSYALISPIFVVGADVLGLSS